jgi:rSAM/selenodomain-associated transferase 1
MDAYAQTSVAIAIMAKAPVPGRAKTRLCPPLTPEEAAALASAFLADVAERVAVLGERVGAASYIAYAPREDVAAVDALVPDRVGLVLQPEGDLGARIKGVVAELLEHGHAGVVVIGSDAPTLPDLILEQAVAIAAMPRRVAMAPMLDGGYGVLALNQPDSTLFTDMPWSTGTVAELTRQRARAAGIELIELPIWYDVDDALSLSLLAAELNGGPLPLGHGLVGAKVPRTEAVMRQLKLGEVEQRRAG